MSSRNPIYIRLLSLVMFLGTVLAIIASVLPWAKITVLDEADAYTIGGFEYGGFRVIVFAVVSLAAIAGFMHNPESHRWLLAVTLLLGAIMIAEQGQLWISTEGGQYKVREGIYLVILGGAMIAAGSVLSFITTEPTKPKENPTQPDQPQP